ncbi:cation:proton antiporter [Rheinheimera baltica]|uniref:Cation:proton antiporter n=1 Tax=Rheinheimera baltica TaxID=67576 RepID=A0ABT9I5E8_9GAMM|nr:cation:proton antiporter [Rheinheimera baltica]MDP5138622.1 cation:proton antiporter [Rheinheimera baltica]MDP5149710.1 cation:proton antiporter [Rheinheimera baltica]
MTDFLLLAFIFLLAGVIAVPLATKLSLGSVLGYLLAGIALGPLLTSLQVDVVSIQHFAEFGVVMMLFIVGLELEPKKLWSMRSRLIGLGGGQVVITTLAIMGVAMVLGMSLQMALAVGLILSMSSTAIVLQTLSERGLLKSDGGQASFSVLLTQDIAVIPMLALIPLLAMPEFADTAAVMAAHSADVQSTDAQSASHSLSLVDNLPGWQAALLTIATIAAVIFGGNYLTTPLFKFVAQARLRELFTATALLFVIGIALMMSLVGLSPALGTFLAGVVLANSPYKHELESNIDPFKGLLLGLFFITVGASVNFTLLGTELGTIILLTLALIVIKMLVLLLLGKLFKIQGAEKWLMAMGLAQAGEFGFVLLSFTVANNVLPQSLADQLLLVVTLSMLVSPLLFICYQRVIAPRFVIEAPSREETFPTHSKIIIAGSGRVGGLVDRILKMAGYNATVVDYSYKRLAALEQVGLRYFFGDATRPDLLSAAGIKDANLLVVALDDAEQITKLVRYVLQNYPHVHVIARAIDRHHVYDLYSYGCRDIIRETYDSTLRIGRSAFEALGVSRENADKMIQVFNQHDREFMLAVADAYEVGVPFEENDAYTRKIMQVLEQQEPLVAKAMQDICNKQ